MMPKIMAVPSSFTDIEKIIDLLSNGVIDIAQLHGNEREEDIKTIKEKTKFYLEFMQIKDFCSLNTH